MNQFPGSDYKQSSWYQYLEHSMKDLVSQSIVLATPDESKRKNRFHDYSYIVFPIAKAYEGFLKKLMFDLELIDQITLDNKYFRIGRSLNPDLPDKYKDKSWLYDDLERVCRDCGDGRLASDIWDIWQTSRNSLFHYFGPQHVNFIGYNEARHRIQQVCTIMERSVDCLWSH